jgi:hypothetical protein
MEAWAALSLRSFVDETKWSDFCRAGRGEADNIIISAIWLSSTT